MRSIFDYTDFRLYLADWYAEKKKANPAYSYQVLTEKAGFRNKGFAYNIINGKKALSGANACKLARAMGLNKGETDYLETLAAFNQATDLTERTRLFERCSAVKPRDVEGGKALVLRKDQYDFYSQWYHAAVRSVIGMHPFKGEFAWLAKTLTPAISIRQARQSVKLLEKLGLIALQPDGTYHLTRKSITSGPDVIALGVQRFHSTCTGLADRAICELPRDQRNITGLTLGISAVSYAKICEETQAFQSRIMRIADGDGKADRVYQFNFHLFPLSQASPERNPS